jgi:hypothetical protein
MMTPKPEDLPEYLRYVTSSRGTIHMPELNTHAYGALHLSESSADTGAFAWLRASAAVSLDQPLSNRTEVVLHVSLEDLAAFVEQAEFMLRFHRKAGEVYE